MIKSSRRSFFALMGSAPLAAKAAADAEIGKMVGMTTNGMGSGGLIYGFPPSQERSSTIPYENQLLKAKEYIKLFGIPEWMEFQMREGAKYVSALDPDIACKKSWSMSVKINEQRQRNYNNRLKHMDVLASHERGRSILRKFLGFEWPF